MFGHEKFGAYQRAIEFISLLAPTLDKIPKGNADLLDQLKRASISIALNIAEGSGRASAREKRRFYVIARGSAMECAAVLDVMKHMEIVEEGQTDQLMILLREIVGILSKVCAAGRNGRGSEGDQDQDQGRGKGRD